MKSSTGQEAEKSPSQTSHKRAARQVSTLYVAAGFLLVVVLVGGQSLVAAQSPAGAVASKSSAGARPSSSASSASSSSPSSETEIVSKVGPDQNQEDHRLALPSSTTSTQLRLKPIGHREASSISSSNTRSSDLTVGQSNIANAKVHVGPHDMTTAAGHHYGGGGKSHGKYYMYAESPKKGAYKMGFRRGNHKHLIERKESSHKGHVHSYFKWHDKKGKGSHKFEFKHYDKKGKHHY